MSYETRLLDCVYTSPSGQAFALLVDEVERSVAKKAAVHELAGRDGAVIQDLGQAARRYPVSGLIAGANYDQTADALAAALEETGKGTLQHPRWGTVPVIPLTYAQKESFVDGARVASFTIDFIHAPDLSVVSTASTAAAILSAADSAAAANVVSLATKTASDLAAIKKKVTTSVAQWKKSLAMIQAAPDSLRTEINAACAFIDRNIGTLVSSPVELCASITALARLPAQVSSSAKNKAAIYASMISDAIGSILTASAAQASISGVSLAALQIAAIESAITGTLASRDEALEAAKTLASQTASVQAAIEILEAAGYIPDPDLLETLAQMAAAASALLLDAAFSLKVERRLTLTADRCPLELLAEILGPLSDPDAALDDFLSHNGLEGDALLVIPRGTEVRYYA